MAGSAELGILLSAINKASGVIDDVGGSLDKLHGKAGKAQSALGPLNNMLGTGIKVAGAAAVAALGAVVVGVVSSVKAAADFEQGLTDVSAAMGINATETGQLKKLIMDLGFDPKLKVNATEATDAIGVLGTAGVEMTDILNGAARSTVLLANATGADFATAGAIAADTMALFGIKADGLQKAISNVTGVTIASKFDINDYRLALAQAGGVAATVGVDFEDFNATIAAISPFFASGSDAGTSFKTFLTSLVPKSAEAADMMKQLGLFTGLTKKEFDDAQTKVLKYQDQLVNLDPTSKNFAERSTELNDKINVLKESLVRGSNAFFDTDGNMKSMAEISGILNTALSGLTEEQKNSTLATIFGSDAMRAAAAIGGMTQEQFTTLKDTIGDTDAEESAAKRMDTLSGVMEIMWGVVDTLKLQIGDAFLPIVRKMAEMFTAQAQIHGPALVEMFKKLADQLGLALAKFLPWVETNLPLMLAQVPALVTNLIDFVQQFVEIGKEVWKAVTPVVEFIAKFVGLKEILIAVGAVMALNAIVSVVAFAGAIWGAVAAVGGLVAAFVPLLLPIAAVGLAIYGLKVAWDNNLGGIQEKAKAVFDWLRGVFTDFPGTIESVKNTFAAWGSGAMSKLREGLVNAQNSVRNGLDVVMDFLQAGRDQRLGPFQQSLYDGGKTVISKLVEGMGALQGAAADKLQEVMTNVKNHGVAYAAGSFAGGMYEGAKGALGRFGAGLAESAPSLKGDIQAALDGVKNVFNDTMSGLKEHVFSVGSGLMERIGDGMRVIDLRGTMSGALQGVIDAFNGTMDSFRNHVYGVMSGIGGRLMDGIKDGIRDGVQSVKDALGWLTDSMPQWVRDRLGIHSPSTVFMGFGENVMAGFTLGMKKLADRPQELFDGVANNLTASLGNMTLSAAGAGGNQMTNSNNRTTQNYFQLPSAAAGGGGGNSEQLRTLNTLTAIYAK